MAWIRINTKVRETLPYSIVRTELELQDEYINLDEITKIENSSVFSIKELPSRPYNFDDDVVQNISIEMDLDLIRISRQVYSGFDALADIGGFMSAISTFVMVTVSFLNGGSIQNYLIERLFV